MKKQTSQPRRAGFVCNLKNNISAIYGAAHAEPFKIRNLLFVRLILQHLPGEAAIKELDETMLHRLINKVLIGEVKKVDGQKVQEVRIVYNFVGEIPEIAA